jgi:hypothetical protein
MGATGFQVFCFLPSFSPFPPHHRARMTKGQLTFRLLHAAGCSGWRCYGDLFERFRTGKRRKKVRR